MCSPVGSLHGGQLSGQRWSEEGQPPPRPRSRHPGNTASGFTSCDWTRQVIFHNSPSPGRLENLTRRLGSCRIQFSTRNDLMQNILKIWLIHLVQFGLFGSTSPPRQERSSRKLAHLAVIAQLALQPRPPFTDGSGLASLPPLIHPPLRLPSARLFALFLCLGKAISSSSEIKTEGVNCR